MSPVRPARKLDLGHQRRFYPSHASCFSGRARKIDEGTAFSDELNEFAVHATERALVKTGANAAGIAQLMLLVVIAERERAEVASSATGLRKTPDDEFLA